MQNLFKYVQLSYYKISKFDFMPYSPANMHTVYWKTLKLHHQLLASGRNRFDTYGCWILHV